MHNLFPIDSSASSSSSSSTGPSCTDQSNYSQFILISMERRILGRCYYHYTVTHWLNRFGCSLTGYPQLLSEPCAIIRHFHYRTNSHSRWFGRKIHLYLNFLYSQPCARCTPTTPGKELSADTGRVAFLWYNDSNCNYFLITGRAISSTLPLHILWPHSHAHGTQNTKTYDLWNRILN